MISGQPDLREVFEAVIGGDLFGREMAMVVDDRHLAGVFVIELTAESFWSKKLSWMKMSFTGCTFRQRENRVWLAIGGRICASLPPSRHGMQGARRC